MSRNKNFIQYYFNLGCETALEKIAKQEKDTEMSTGAKVGLGALGAAALGTGAYFGRHKIKDAAKWIKEKVKDSGKVKNDKSKGPWPKKDGYVEMKPEI